MRPARSAPAQRRTPRHSAPRPAKARASLPGRDSRRPRRGFSTFLVALLVVGTVVAGWRAGLIPVLGSARAATAKDRGTHGIRGLFDGSRSVGAGERGDAVAGLAAKSRPVFCGAGTKPLVALTFDDGPGPYTAKTLRVLRRAGARATFFVVGKKLVDGASWDSLTTDEASLGEVADHTWDHLDLRTLQEGSIRDQIVRVRSAVEARGGGTPVLLRPPYGARDARLDAIVRSLGMVEILWSIDSGDSTPTATTDSVRSTVLDEIRPGSIVLLHENRGTTRDALPDILRGIADRGLTPVTVSELLALDPPTETQLREGRCP